MLARRGAVRAGISQVVRRRPTRASIWCRTSSVRLSRVSRSATYVVPFGDCQREISVTCPSNLRVIMYRRIMYSVAERIAHIEGAKAIVTGESLGQVASQTLENIMAVNEAVKIPCSVLSSVRTSRRSSRAPRRSVRSISRLRPLPTAARCLCRVVPRRTLNSMPCMRHGSCSITRR